MYLLDINVISELRKKDTGRANPHVVAWESSLLAEQLYLSVITLLELQRGALLMQRRDRIQGAMLTPWLTEQVVPAFRGRILSVDPDIAKACAALHVPDPRPAHDALIAANALIRGFTVVTRNIADFTPTGVPTLNPWDPQP